MSLEISAAIAGALTRLQYQLGLSPGQAVRTLRRMAQIPKTMDLVVRVAGAEYVLGPNATDEECVTALLHKPPGAA